MPYPEIDFREHLQLNLANVLAHVSKFLTNLIEVLFGRRARFHDRCATRDCRFRMCGKFVAPPPYEGQMVVQATLEHEAVKVMMRKSPKHRNVVRFTC